MYLHLAIQRGSRQRLHIGLLMYPIPHGVSPKHSTTLNNKKKVVYTTFFFKFEFIKI